MTETQPKTPLTTAQRVALEDEMIKRFRGKRTKRHGTQTDHRGESP